MAEIEFDIDTTIYQNREYLRDSTPPEQIVGRDDELDEYKNALLPVVNDEEPNNTFIYGKTGTGKTDCTTFILKSLQNQIDASPDLDIPLEVLQINCEGISSSYTLAIELVNELRPMDDQISESGYKEKRVYSMLFEELDAIGGTVIIVLDELDAVDPDKLNGILYQIPRARKNGYLEETKVGIIGISNDLTILEDLRPDVKSTLSEKHIHFDPYDTDELSDVLTQRSKKAFYDDAVDSSVIRYCAALGAKNGGDARRAITLLREAGDIARGENSDSVTKDHVDRAKEQLQQDKIITSISSLSDNEKMTLYSLVTLECEGNDNPRSREVYERYRTLASNTVTSEVTYRTVRDYLNEFQSIKLTESNGSVGGEDGTYRTHSLNFDVGPALAELEDVIQDCGVHSAIRTRDEIQHLLD